MITKNQLRGRTWTFRSTNRSRPVGRTAIAALAVGAILGGGLAVATVTSSASTGTVSASPIPLGRTWA